MMRCKFDGQTFPLVAIQTMLKSNFQCRIKSIDEKNSLSKIVQLFGCTLSSQKSEKTQYNICKWCGNHICFLHWMQIEAFGFSIKCFQCRTFDLPTVYRKLFSLYLYKCHMVCAHGVWLPLILIACNCLFKSLQCHKSCEFVPCHQNKKKREEARRSAKRHEG